MIGFLAIDPIHEDLMSESCYDPPDGAIWRYRFSPFPFRVSCGVDFYD
jgi:hypothetical protein